MSFYAVARGRKQGIYSSWEEAKAQVIGFSKARFKKFDSKAEALAFVNNISPQKKQPAASFVKASEKQQTVASFVKASEKQQTAASFVKPDPLDPNSLVAFTDGSALGNGMVGCKAGFAAIFPHNPSWNIVKSLQGEKLTNNRAEYSAAIEAIRQANKYNADQTKPLFIFSDSLLLIKSMEQWLPKWIRQDFQGIKNKDLLQLIVEERGKRVLIWKHVRAHTKKTDWASKWNDIADKAAKKAAANQ